MQKNEKITPLMRQYSEIKEKFTDTLLFFQVGDFYELFFDDAKNAASFLGITLTKRGTHNGVPVPLCGVPLHAAQFYISKLVKGGFRVAICDQLEDAVPGKIVDRGVKQVFTPGTLTDSSFLDEKSPSYLATLYLIGDTIYLLFAEILTGNMYATCINNHINLLESELERFGPDEILIAHTKSGGMLPQVLKKFGYFVTMRALDISCIESDEGFFQWCQTITGLEKSYEMKPVMYLLFKYLKDNHQEALHVCKQLRIYKAHDFLVLDVATQRNLELVKNTNNGSIKHTLFSTLDTTMTPMGSRTIKKWLVQPLIDQKKIKNRLGMVEIFLNNINIREDLRKLLKSVGDFERIIGRIALDCASLHDYRLVIEILNIIPDICTLLSSSKIQQLVILLDKIGDLSALTTVLEAAINTDTTVDFIIKDGFDKELDRLRLLITSGTYALSDLEKKEQESTNIQSLKIRYSNVHGYCFEVTKTNYHLVPERFQRIQTLSGRERYVTQELKDLERDIIRAQKEVHLLEQEVFKRVKKHVLEYLSLLKKTCQITAYLDVFSGFADVAYTNNYVKPTFNDMSIINVVDGRHPVVEQTINGGFIPNDITLNNDQSLLIITGPNMGGKSTFLRQVALICIMAQCGSFVPARSADLPVIDRIFTRIGAADNLSQGKSTFLLEMEETAIICNEATSKSLVILDEVGRGTSTFDGLAIAQAVVEFLHKKIRARGLFATHYHELTELGKQHKGIAVFHAAISKRSEKLLFLYKIIPGTADGSFGIDVAELANLPAEVVDRARAILSELS